MSSDCQGALISGKERTKRYVEAYCNSVRLDCISGQMEKGYRVSWLVDVAISGERWLDFLGMMPAVSNISAVFRAIFGLEEVAYGTLHGICSLTLYGSSKTAKNIYHFRKEEKLLTEEEREKLQKIDEFSQIFIKNSFMGLFIFTHGMANIGRAMIEFVPLIGNGITAIYMAENLRLSYCAADLAIRPMIKPDEEPEI